MAETKPKKRPSKDFIFSLMMIGYFFVAVILKSSAYHPIGFLIYLMVFIAMIVIWIKQKPRLFFLIAFIIIFVGAFASIRVPTCVSSCWGCSDRLGCWVSVFEYLGKKL